MRLTGLTLVAVVAIALAGCGDDGSATGKTVNGCVIQPAASCAGADLSGEDLSGSDLTKADLSGANLTDVNLSGADLTQANLSDAQIVNADLSDSDLTGANLTGATIEGTNLDGAYLCGTTRTDGTTDDTSCPASGGTTTTDTTTTETDTETTETTDTDSTEATITSFTVGTPDCPSGATDGTVEVSWETDAATAVEFSIDGADPTAATSFGPSGQEELSIPCDGASHDIELTALSDAGAGQTETKTVET